MTKTAAAALLATLSALAVLNPWVLARWLSPDGGIESVPVRVGLGLLDLGLLATALLVVRRRDRIRPPRGRTVALLATTVLVGLVGLEGAVRALGLAPRLLPTDEVDDGRPPPDAPGGEARVLVPHPVLGHAQRAGEFDLETTTGYRFHATHHADGRRATRPLDAPATGARPEIWIFGCSFTYGWSLHDEETYPWRVQEALPGYDVLNFGVIAYGTIHAWLQLQELVETRPKPAAAVLAYASFHDERNANLRSRQRRFVSWGMGEFPQPYARLDREGGVRYSMAEPYEPFPLAYRSAVMRAVEKSYDTLETRLSHPHDISKEIVRDMAGLCREHGIPFVVAGITNAPLTRDMLAFAEGLGALTVDMSVDLTVKANRNYPHDPHPSALANEHYAEVLAAFLGSEL